MPYTISLSSRAEQDYYKIIDHLIQKWTTKEVKAFSVSFTKALEQISSFPLAYPAYKTRKSIRKFVLDSHNIIFYKINKKEIEIISVWAGKQSPQKLKL